MPEAFLMNYRGAKQIAAHNPVFMTFEEASALHSDLGKVLARYLDPQPLEEGETWPPTTVNEQRASRAAQHVLHSSLEDLA